VSAAAVAAVNLVIGPARRGRRIAGMEHRDADFTTMSGVPVEPVYGPPDAERPGEYPYTRGPYASMYRSKLWTMRMFAGFGTAIDTNRRFTNC
jgi:methylmalonyl-CoA mutase N-terminal domain/subunit